MWETFNCITHLGRHKRRHDGNKPHERGWLEVWDCMRRHPGWCGVPIQPASTFFSQFSSGVFCWDAQAQGGEQPTSSAHLLWELSTSPDMHLTSQSWLIVHPVGLLPILPGCVGWISPSRTSPALALKCCGTWSSYNRQASHQHPTGRPMALVTRKLTLEKNNGKF